MTSCYSLESGLQAMKEVTNIRDRLSDTSGPTLTILLVLHADGNLACQMVNGSDS